MWFLLPFELLPLASATPSWLLIEELLLHGVVITGFVSGLFSSLSAGKAQTFFLYVSADNSIWVLEKCLFCIDLCI